MILKIEMTEQEFTYFEPKIRDFNNQKEKPFRIQAYIFDRSYLIHFPFEAFEFFLKHHSTKKNLLEKIKPFFVS